MECTLDNGKIYFLEDDSKEYCEQIMKDCIKLIVHCSNTRLPNIFDTLPKFLKILQQHKFMSFNWLLPPKLHCIFISTCYEHRVQLSSRLKQVLMSETYNSFVKIPKTVKIYYHGLNNSYTCIPSKNLSEFFIGHKYNAVIDLPKKLEHFLFSRGYGQKIILPAHIKGIVIIPHSSVSQKQIRIILTENMQTIKNHKNNHFIMDNLPECLNERVYKNTELNYMNEID